jgi:hypothetical protein
MAATAPTNQFQTGVSTSGVPVFAQPAFGNLSGTAAPSQLPAATTVNLGAVQVGTGLSVSSGTVSLPSVNTSGSGTYGNITTDAQGRITAVRAPAFTDVTGTATLGQIPTIPASQTSGLLPLTGGTMSGALVNNTSVKSTTYLNGGGLVASGTTLPHWLNFAAGGITGFYSGAQSSLLNIGFADYLAASNQIYGFGVNENVYSGAGNRAGVETNVNGAQTPSVPGGIYDGALLQGAMNSNSGSYNPIGVTDFHGASEGANAHGYINGNGWFGGTGLEADLSIQSGDQVATATGLGVVEQGPGRGIFLNDGISINASAGDADWTNAINVGGSVVDWPIIPAGSGANSAIFRITPRQLFFSPGTSIWPSADWGLDFRALTLDRYSLGMPNFSVDPNGNIYGNALSTLGSVQAQSAGISGITITSGGVFNAWPAFTVQAPPTGGTTATATVSTMGGIELLTGFGSTGSGSSVGATCTYAAGTGSSVGTPPTFVVSSVDANGGITGLTLPTAGTGNEGATTTVPPPATPINLTCSAGTGAQIVITWAADFANGVYIPSATMFTATGANYLVGDTIAPSGDTGTEPTYTVSAVTAQGGITSTTLASAGSVTAIFAGTSGSPPYYQSVTGGAGTGASVQAGWAITGFTTTAGSGYTAGAPPLLVMSATTTARALRLAMLTATLSNTPTTLTLNPSGGNVTTPGNFSAYQNININSSTGASSYLNFYNGATKEGWLNYNASTGAFNLYDNSNFLNMFSAVQGGNIVLGEPLQITGSIPSVSAGTISGGSNSTRGTVTFASGTSTAVVTFPATLKSVPYCTASTNSTADTVSVTAQSTASFTLTTSVTTGAIITYHCLQ